MDRTSKEHVKPIRQKWFGVACCPPNIARTLASLGQYIYAKDEETLYLNLYVSGEAKAVLDGKEVEIITETQFPWENSGKILLRNVSEKGMKLALRIPDYVENYEVEINGNVCEYQIEKGYAYMDIQGDSVIAVRFEAPPRFVRANPEVHADCGKVALVRGPLVYCLEQADNGENLSAVYVNADTKITEEKAELFGGSVLLSFEGHRINENNWSEKELYGNHRLSFDKVMLKAIPYAYWNNRGIGEMSVWIKELI